MQHLFDPVADLLLLQREEPSARLRVAVDGQLLLGGGFVLRREDAVLARTVFIAPIAIGSASTDRTIVPRRSGGELVGRDAVRPERRVPEMLGVRGADAHGLSFFHFGCSLNFT